MLRFVIRSLTGILPIFLLSIFISAQNVGNISVGPNVPVSKLRSDWEHNEVVLAVDPSDRRKMLAGSMFLDPERSTYSNVVYLTTDGGRNWTPTLEDRKGPGFMGDPTAAFGCDGKTAFYVSLRFPQSLGSYETLFYRSNDGGRTWGEPTIMPGMDREYVSVDCTKAKHHGTVYIHGSRKGVAIFRSKDKGRTFSETNVTPITKDKNYSKQGNGVILSDGTVLVPFNIALAELAVIRSDDGGATFSEPTIISKLKSLGHIPYFAVDRTDGTFRDRVYLAWKDAMSESQPGSQIWMSFSDDKGEGWSLRTRVNDRFRTTDGKEEIPNFMPSVAVNQDGVVGVSWYEGRESEDWTVRFAASCDGGRSFLPSVKVSEAGFKRSRMTNKVVEANVGGGRTSRKIRNSPISFRTDGSIRTSGDTAGLEAGSGGVFHAIWIENRTGVQQVWTAPISVNVKTACPGIGNLRGLNMVTNQLGVEVEKAKYDPETRSMSANLYFVNLSDKTLEGSLLYQIIDARGIEFVNSDNQIPGKGATFEFKTQGKLAPGQRTQSRSIRYRWNGPPEGVSPGAQPSLSSQITGDVFGKWSK